MNKHNNLLNDLNSIDETYLYLLDNGIDKNVKLIPDEVRERVSNLKEKARAARGEK